MKLTKYGHACVVLEEQGKKLVVDPGEFTEDFVVSGDIVGVVITHVHGDHLQPKQLEAIAGANPGVQIFTTEEAAKECGNVSVQTVKAGDEQTAGPFALRFYGQLHNAVHADWPQNQNLGVLVNDAFYYPGDSFTLPDRKVELLAVPVSAPWLKLGESLEFIKIMKPARFFRTHDGLCNERGLAGIDVWLTKASDKYGSAYHGLNPGDSTEL